LDELAMLTIEALNTQKCPVESAVSKLKIMQFTQIS
jgi:hypothetical protein